MAYWKNVDPVGAIADFRTVFQQAGRNRWRIAALAAAATIAVFSIMFQEEHRILPRKPNVIYITTWQEGRSDAEIMASNLANQRYQDQLRAEQAKRDEEVRQLYKKIGRMSGMDVDAIERKAQAERQAEEAAERAAAKQPGAAGSQPQSQLARP